MSEEAMTVTDEAGKHLKQMKAILHKSLSIHYASAIQLGADAIEVLQAENARLLRAVADGGIKAGELTARVIDLERRLRTASKAAWAFESRLNRDAAGSMIEPTYEANCEALRAACDLDAPLKEE